MKTTEIKKEVRKRYGGIAVQGSVCSTSGISCCGSANLAEDISKKIGYSESDIKNVPEGANLGLGCGNPVALASLKEGETVLDLGSGAGFDCFLAANKVGKGGKVIGVDMTPEMLEKARKNARKGKYANVEFRPGEIENLPVADSSIDVIISNCVINLSPDKNRVFREAFRVLKTGGRFYISDLVLLESIPDAIKNSIEAYVSCISGALLKKDYLDAIKTAGFKQVRILSETTYPIEFMANDPVAGNLIKEMALTREMVAKVAGSVASIKVYGRKI